MKHNLIKALYIWLGFLFLGIGAVGVVLPVLPTTPFLLLASFFFARGSKKFNDWFLSTKLYKNHLESFVTNRSMELKTKIKLLIPASTMLILATFIVDVPYFKIFILILIAYKYYYFTFNIKTIKAPNTGGNILEETNSL